MSSTFSFPGVRQRRSAAWHYHQRVGYRHRKLGYDGFPLRLEQIAYRENLYRCYLQLKCEGGQAPGVDGLRAADLTPSEAGELTGVLSTSLLEQTYRPHKVRKAPIPKASTDEFRILKLGVLTDRIVGKALHNAFSEFWERQFLPCSYGFRRGLRTWSLLADLELSRAQLNRSVVAIADIRKAFDNVPIDTVVALHRQALAELNQNHFTDEDKERTVALIDTVLRGHDKKRKIGIDQGGPYSPAALNVLLHHTLDVPLTRYARTKPLWHRYVDNLVYLCQRASEGRNVLRKVAKLLEPLGLTLKQEAEVVNLNAGDGVQLLGFTLRATGEQLSYGIAPTAYATLHERLSAVQLHHNPPAAARQTVMGWVDALGPAYENGDSATVLSIAAEHGFRELSPDDVQARWKESWTRWQTCRNRRATKRGHQAL